MKYSKQIIASLERNIQNLPSNPENPFEKIELGISYCQQSLRKLRHRILAHGFASPQVECQFFKHIKPKALGYLIYFLYLSDFEMSKPKTTAKKLKSFIQQYITDYQNYFLEHKEFYLYLKRNRNDRDCEYFLRFQGAVKFHSDALPYCMDNEFSTSHDFIAAKIFAHNLLIEHLNKELILSHNSQSTENQIPYNILWTGTKTDLIELMYALHETGAINNGNTEIKGLADFFQLVFKIDLGEYYRTYIEIRARKINPTKFLDRMKNNLLTRITEADN